MKEKIRWTLTELCKKSGKQFYDEKGKPCTVEKYVDLCLSQKLEDAKKYQEKYKNEPKQ